MSREACSCADGRAIEQTVLAVERTRLDGLDTFVHCEALLFVRMLRDAIVSHVGRRGKNCAHNSAGRKKRTG